MSFKIFSLRMQKLTFFSSISNRTVSSESPRTSKTTVSTSAPISKSYYSDPDQSYPYYTIYDDDVIYKDDGKSKTHNSRRWLILLSQNSRSFALEQFYPTKSSTTISFDTNCIFCFRRLCPIHGQSNCPHSTTTTSSSPSTSTTERTNRRSHAKLQSVQSET